MSWAEFFLGFGSLQGAVLGTALLVVRAQNPIANRLMASLLLLISAQLLHIWAVMSEFYLDQPWAGLWLGSTKMAWGPLLYLYALRLIRLRINAWHCLHFLPVFLMFTPNFSFLNSAVDEQLLVLNYLMYREVNVPVEVLMPLIPSGWKLVIDYHLEGTFFALQFSVYCLYVLSLIRQHRQNLEAHFSSTEALDLKWLKTLAQVCLMFILIYFVFNRSQFVIRGFIPHYDIWTILPFLFLVFAIYAIGFMALYQPNIIGTIQVVANLDSDKQLQKDMSFEADEPKTQKSKYQLDHLDNETLDDAISRLHQAMEIEHLYLDAELTMPQLAKQVGLKSHQVSQLLNGPMGQTFFSFVNHYRIELAQVLLADPEKSKLPIVELALEVGFKSKSSFYDAFKKSLQMTPTQFKKMAG